MSDESKTHAVTIYLKSGNVLPLHNVEEFSTQRDSNTGKLKGFSWALSPNTIDPYKLLYVDIDNIEAILVQEEE